MYERGGDDCSVACNAGLYVCGVDGRTYGSYTCASFCNGVEVAYEGECQQTCDCPEIYEPVCGVDDIVYGNQCQADCARVAIAYEGECMQNCQPVVCDLFCEFGFKVDANGCNLCECNPNPMAVDCSQAPYSDPRYQYFGRSPEECQLVRFSCMDPKTYVISDLVRRLPHTPIKPTIFGRIPKRSTSNYSLTVIFIPSDHI